ncbi:MAG: SdiA-regulated domain-containing protein [Alphaproteobacteria bacterium]
MRRAVIAALCAAFGICASAGSAQERGGLARALTNTPEREFYLPKGLSEVSGLTPASDHSVFAHNDEYGIVYEIDLGTGKVVKAFALGKPTVKGDFEDIVARGGSVYLLTSDGRIYEARVGEHRKRVLYNVYDTGVGERCETEGLTIGPAGDDFLILCKIIRDPALKERLVVFAWNLRERTPVSTPWLNVPLDGLIEELDQANFHPSAFAWRRDAGTLVIVSAKGRTAIEVDLQGRLISRVKLEKRRHNQPEALTFMPDGRFLLGDEGVRGRGKISVYAPPR